MKSLEIKRIGIGSVFRFYFVVGIVVGLIASVVILIAGLPLSSIGMNYGFFHGSFTGAMQIGITVVGIIIGSLGYGVALGLSGVIGALLYNLFAAATGGIVIKVKE